MRNNQTQMLILAALFVAVTAVCAQIRIPIGAVPFTMQIFAISLMGVVLGSRWGVISALGYLILGAVGAPVFSGFSGGLQVLIGKTGGYLFGFIPAAYVIGWITERGRLTVSKAVWANLAGLVIIYAIGAMQLKLVLNLPWVQAFEFGIYPFIIPDIVKLVLASILGVSLINRLASAGLRAKENLVK